MPDNFLSRHTQVPVCRTFHGCIEHVRLCSLKERWRLAYVLECDPDQVPRKLYAIVSGKNGKAKKTNN